MAESVSPQVEGSKKEHGTRQHRKADNLEKHVVKGPWPNEVKGMGCCEQRSSCL